MPNIPCKPSGRPTVRPDDGRLIQLYVYEGMTSTELSRMFDVSPSTVRSWVSRLRREARDAGTPVPGIKPHGSRPRG